MTKIQKKKRLKNLIKSTIKKSKIKKSIKNKRQKLVKEKRKKEKTIILYETAQLTSLLSFRKKRVLKIIKKKLKKNLLSFKQKIFLKKKIDNFSRIRNSIFNQIFFQKLESMKLLSVLGKFIKEKKIKVVYEKKVPENIIFPPIKPLVLKKKATKIVKARELQQVVNDVKDITVLNITLKPNNIFCIFTDNNGDTLMRSSSTGGLKIIVSKKTMKRSIHLVLKKFHKRFQKRLKKRKISFGEVIGINVKGSRRSRKTVIFAIKKIFFKEFCKKKVIIDYPYIKSFNGCRGLSLKRKKRWHPRRYSSVTS